MGSCGWGAQGGISVLTERGREKRSLPPNRCAKKRPGEPVAKRQLPPGQDERSYQKLTMSAP